MRMYIFANNARNLVIDLCTFVYSNMYKYAIVIWVSTLPLA